MITFSKNILFSFIFCLYFHSCKVSPNGPFKWHQRIDMTGMIGTSNTGDQTVFTDEDTGKSYLVYSYGKGRNKIYISQIGVKDSSGSFFVTRSKVNMKYSVVKSYPSTGGICPIL